MSTTTHKIKEEIERIIFTTDGIFSTFKTEDLIAKLSALLDTQIEEAVRGNNDKWLDFLEKNMDKAKDVIVLSGNDLTVFSKELFSGD